MNKNVASKSIGVPVRAVNWVWLTAGENRNGSPCLYATMGQCEPNPLFVCQIDIQTGACRRFDAAIPQSNFPTAAFWSPRRKRLFVGGAHSGHLFQFDPMKESLDDLGAIHPEKAIFP